MFPTTQFLNCSTYPVSVWPAIFLVWSVHSVPVPSFCSRSVVLLSPPHLSPSPLSPDSVGCPIGQGIEFFNKVQFMYIYVCTSIWQVGSPYTLCNEDFYFTYMCMLPNVSCLSFDLIPGVLIRGVHHTHVSNMLICKKQADVMNTCTTCMS